MAPRYVFLRSASKTIFILGVFVTIASFVFGISGLLTRDMTSSGLETALFTIGGMAAGIVIAAGGQLLQVFVDISDSLQRIEANTLATKSETQAETIAA